MNINLNTRKPYNNKNELPSTDFFKTGRIGFWAHVIQLHSDSLTVDIAADDNGYEYYYIPVISKEWVNSDDKTGSRDLPPINSSVFVLTPTKSIQGAFVLCSGYAKTQPAESAEFVASSSQKTEIDKANNSMKKISTAGWITEENRENGNITIKSDDEKVKIEITMADDSTSGTKKNVTITAWDNVIKLDADGVSITSNKAVELKTSGDFTLDAASNNIKLKCSKFSVNDTDFSVG